jgi:hypothetical protein
MGQDRWASRSRAPTNPQEDKRAVHQRQKRTDTGKQQDRVLEEEEEEEEEVEEEEEEEEEDEEEEEEDWP